MPRKGGVPENLKPLKKGYDPNRNMKGRPKSIVTELNELLSDRIQDQKSGKYIDKGRAILDVLITKGLRGDIRAIQEILDRLYGKAKQEIDLHIPELKVQTLDQEEQERINKSLEALNESYEDISQES